MLASWKSYNIVIKKREGPGLKINSSLLETKTPLNKNTKSNSTKQPDLSQWFPFCAKGYALVSDRYRARLVVAEKKDLNASLFASRSLLSY